MVHAHNAENESQHARQEAVRIVTVLRDHGHEAYLAGGCVRDELLGIAPEDYDVATDATPDGVHELFPRAQSVGKAFGVMHVRMRVRKGETIVTEVATFRKDAVYTDRRRPDSVTFTDAREDAFRRDFTINALFLDPMDDAHDVPSGGRVIDYVNGVEDLRSGIVRAVGDPEARLAEDHLRGLRAVRFAARFGFEIETKTAAAITAHASKLKGVSEERIGDEVRRMFTHSSRTRAGELLEAFGLASAALGAPATGARGAVLLGHVRDDADFAVALGAWAIDRGTTAQLALIGEIAILADTVPGQWRRALKLSNDETEAFHLVLVGACQIERDWAEASMARQKRIASSGWFSHALALVRARDGQRGVDQGIADGVCQMVTALEKTPGGLAPEPLITGEDLIAAGLRPGPTFKARLRAAYDAQLEGQATTGNEALKIAMAIR